MIFLHNKRDLKLLKLILMTKNLTLGSSQPLPFTCAIAVVKVERRTARIQIGGASVYTLILM